jgi:hypothetical protein
MRFQGPALPSGTASRRCSGARTGQTCYSLAATTRASRTPLPAASPPPCSTRSSAEPVASRAMLSHRAYLLMVTLIFQGQMPGAVNLQRSCAAKALLCAMWRPIYKLPSCRWISIQTFRPGRPDSARRSWDPRGRWHRCQRARGAADEHVRRPFGRHHRVVLDPHRIVSGDNRIVPRHLPGRSALSVTSQTKRSAPRKLFGLGAQLSPVQILPTAELAAHARSAPLIGKLEAFAAWLGRAARSAQGTSCPTPTQWKPPAGSASRAVTSRTSGSVAMMPSPGGPVCLKRMSEISSWEARPASDRRRVLGGRGRVGAQAWRSGALAGERAVRARRSGSCRAE